MFLYIIIFKVTPKSYSRMNEPLCTTFNHVQAVGVISDILIALLGELMVLICISVREWYSSPFNPWTF